MYFNSFLITYIAFLIFNVAETQYGPMPNHLIECYQNDDLILLPMTMTTLIDIIRKVEFNHEYIMDMRMLSNSILRRFWRDGIQKNPNINPEDIQYTTEGFQSYKYSLIYSNLIPGTGRVFPNDSLTINERCTLHFMLSGSVDPWERGDEAKTCRQAAMAQNQFSYGFKKSSCPIEEGVVFTDGYGTVNAGHILLAIAMALQPMQVEQFVLLRKNTNISPNEKYNKLIDNLWVSTICGDLAEIIVFQKPITNNVSFGPSGNWNNSYMPTDYYMNIDQNALDYGCWQDTNAEILGSIDGLIMANEAVRWSNVIYTLKLSQLLEMFYTNNGGNFPGQIHVCKRKNYFLDDLENQKQIIKEQTENFAVVLALIAPHSFVNDEQYISQNIDAVVNTFIQYTTQLFTQEQASCPEYKEAKPKLQLVVIYDSTWSPFYTIQFLMRLSSHIDISHYGGNITVINGDNGATVVDSANTEGDLYFQWENALNSNKEVKASGLLKGFLTLKNIIESNNTQTCTNVVPSGIVTLVLGASVSITDRDFTNIFNTIKIIKNECPDMTFIYLTNQANSRTFTKFSSLPRAQYDYVITVDNNNQERIIKDLNYIKKVPRTLKPTPCTNNRRTFVELTYEEYILPNIVYNYRINPAYLCSSNKTITIKVENYDYGNIEFCISQTPITNDLKNVTCNYVGFFDVAEFKIDDPCSVNNLNKISDWSSNCNPIFLKIQGKKSVRKCSGKHFILFLF